MEGQTPQDGRTWQSQGYMRRDPTPQKRLETCQGPCANDEPAACEGMIWKGTVRPLSLLYPGVRLHPDIITGALRAEVGSQTIAGRQIFMDLQTFQCQAIGGGRTLVQGQVAGW